MVLRFVRTYRLFFLGALTCGCACGVTYLALAPPYYIARGTVLIDNRASRSVQEPTTASERAPDVAFTDSQVEVIRSMVTVGKVVDGMHLAQDPEFNGAHDILPRVRAAIEVAVGSNPSTMDDTPALTRLRAIDRVRNALDVRRLGASQVVEVTFLSHDAQKGADIANGIIRSYVAGELESKARITTEASLWLEQAIDDHRVRALDADKRLQDFKKSDPLDGVASRAFLLRELTDAVDVTQGLYQALQRRYAETVLQLSFRAPEIRVLDWASPPLRKSGPRTLVLLVFCLFGLTSSIVIAALIEASDCTIKTGEQLEAVGLEFVGSIYPARNTSSSPRVARWLWPRRKRKGDELDPEGVWNILARVNTCIRSQEGYALTFMGVAGTETHSVVATGVAVHGAMQWNTLLLAGSPFPERRLGKLATNRIVPAGATWWETRLDRGSVAGVDILQSASWEQRPNTLGAGPKLRSCVIGEARSRYQLIAVDLPNQLEAADRYFTFQASDGIILVIEAGAGSTVQLQEAVRLLEAFRSKVVGAILYHSLGGSC